MYVVTIVVNQKALQVSGLLSLKDFQNILTNPQ